MPAIAGASVAAAALIVALLVLLISDSAVLSVIAGAATAGLGTAFLLRRSTASIGAVTKAAASLADGNLASRVPVTDASMTRDLSAAFNEMAASIERLVQGASLDRGRLVAALNSSLDAIVAIDRNSDVRFANTAAGKLIASEPEALVGRPLAWVLPEPQVVDTVRQVMATGEPATALVERPNRQFYRAAVAPIIGGGEWAVLVLLHDLTEVRRVEQVRRDFIGNVSHELRTPLAAVKSVIETLAGSAIDDREVAREFLDRANNETDRLIQIVEDQLELSRIESGEVLPVRHPVDLLSVVRDAVDRLRPSADKVGLSLTFEAPASLPFVPGDARQLERAVINLVQNAIKFTPSGGSIGVRIDQLADGLRVSVQDTGDGIEAKDLPRVFERFYKGDHSRGSAGAGLGLAIVKHTIEAHGGRVAAESTAGRGSTFSFVLPVVTDA
jgi:two-component system phosphate regulon sensor histidine kinase PhoR